DDPGKPGGHRSDAEDHHEHAVDVDAEHPDHRRILDPGAHDHAEPGAVQHEIEHRERGGGDGGDDDAVGRIDEKPHRRHAGGPARRHHRLRQAAEDHPHQLDDDDADAEGDEQLVLRRPAVEMADDDQLDDPADNHQ